MRVLKLLGFLSAVTLLGVSLSYAAPDKKTNATIKQARQQNLSLRKPIQKIPSVSVSQPTKRASALTNFRYTTRNNGPAGIDSGVIYNGKACSDETRDLSNSRGALSGMTEPCDKESNVNQPRFRSMSGDQCSAAVLILIDDQNYISVGKWIAPHGVSAFTTLVKPCLNDPSSANLYQACSIIKDAKQRFQKSFGSSVPTSKYDSFLKWCNI